MEMATDCLSLTDHKLFSHIKSVISKSSNKTRNIVDCKDGILYVWDSSQCCVLTLVVKVASVQDSQFQTLFPTDPPSFEVDCIRVNGIASQVAIVGPHGVSILDIPRRWGKASTFQGGKPVISCRCAMLDERFFVCSPNIEIRQSRWHISSLTDSHLLVLTSENTLRLYQTAGGYVGLVQVWTIGRQPLAVLSSAANYPFLVGLGDTAVDFDFVPPISDLVVDSSEDDSKANAKIIPWPILVLCGNGDVYMVVASLDGKNIKKPKIFGPLSMYPPADDNYGADACSVLCLQSTPPVVVIATCSGTFYHCVLLSCKEEEDDNLKNNLSKPRNEFGSSFAFHSPDTALYVYESIELELGLALDENDDAYTCPIHLHHDVATESRYYCTHDAGVHVMSLPLINQLDHFANASDDDLNLISPFPNQASSVEYLVCTRTSSSSPLSPIQGLTFYHPPTIIITLLSSGEVVSLQLKSVEPMPFMPLRNENEERIHSENESPLKSMLKESFDTRIRMYLKHDVSQPILKLSPSAEPSPQECMELLGRTTQLFHEEYFQRHDKARDEIERRVRTLQAVKRQQIMELEQMVEEEMALKREAERLAEKYEDIKDKQEELTRRAETILFSICQKQPVMTVAEEKLSTELRQVQEKLKEFRKSLEQVKAKQNFHKVQMEQWMAHQKKKEFHLGHFEQKTIKDNLAQMTEEISELVEKVHITQNELDLK